MTTLRLVKPEKTKPVPNTAIIQILSDALKAAEEGRVQSVAIAMLDDYSPVYRHGCEEGQEAALSVLCTQLAEDLRYQLLGIGLE